MEGIRGVFGRNVQKYRNLKNWSQAELAEKIDISPTFMMHIEHGTRGVSMETIELLARCFGIPYAKLFEADDPGTEDPAALLIDMEVRLKKELSQTVERCVGEMLSRRS